MSDIELAYRLTRSRIVAITGTNGKTTVTTLLRDVLSAAGRSAVSCGNIGNSFARVVDDLDPNTLVVLEASSFQLTYVDRFRPWISLLLNLSPNHLDWHHDYEEYVQSKCRMFQHQAGTDVAVINRSDRECLARSQQVACRVVYFDERDHANLNYAAVQKVADLLQVDPAATQSVFGNFSGLEHRLEEIGTVEGVRYIDDSKSTTIASLKWALDRVGTQVLLIAGGRHKGGNFRTLRPQVQEKVKHLLVFGESKAELTNAFRDLVPTHQTNSLQEAMEFAREISRPQDTVLLSPACASFDLFRDYRDRGEQFKNLVTQWRETLTTPTRR